MYKVATFLIDHFWGDPCEMANSLGVLLLTWNQAFYRYGPFDFDKLEQCIAQNIDSLNRYRQRDILTFTIDDDRLVRDLFKQFLNALRICEGKSKGQKTPVGTAKAMHLLAPSFFPIWDDLISNAYNCPFSGVDFPEDRYIQFIRKMKQVVREIQGFSNTFQNNRTLLKLIDEYNYAKYTKGWI
ncbi:MAG: hypothetical protein M1281_00090 [Chloroflexi bacterium]|nr:hypothetical protein [Chloroflexota bacterium]